MLSGTAVTIIVSMIIVALMKWQNYEMQKAKKETNKISNNLKTALVQLMGQYKGCS